MFAQLETLVGLGAKNPFSSLLSPSIVVRSLAIFVLFFARKSKAVFKAANGALLPIPPKASANISFASKPSPTVACAKNSPVASAKGSNTTRSPNCTPNLRVNVAVFPAAKTLPANPEDNISTTAIGIPL